MRSHSRKMKKHLLCLLFVFLLPILANADDSVVHYVAEFSHTPSAPYASWSTAASNVQEAINSSVSGDQVWISRGVYRPTARSTGFTMKTGVDIYGGFAGTETTLSERTGTNNLTILSGDMDGNDLTNAAGYISNIVTNPDAIQGNNSYHVMYWESETGGVCRLDSLYVSGGRGNNPGASSTNIGDGATDPDLQGAGICALGKGHLILTNCTISGNWAGTGRRGHYYYGDTDGATGGFGGGIYSEALLEVLTCTISGNQAGTGGLGGAAKDWYRSGHGGSGGSGGGIYAAASLIIRNSTVFENAGGTGGYGGGGDGPFRRGNGGDGGSGGGIYAASLLHVVDSQVEANSGGGAGESPPAGGYDAGNGGSGGSGGGIYMEADSSIAHSVLKRNNAGTGCVGAKSFGGDGGNGGAGGSGGSLYALSALCVSNCLFDGNATGHGADGGLALIGGFDGNGGAGGNGGAIRCLSNCTVISSLIMNGSTGNGGDGNSVTAGSGGSGGGFHVDGELTILNCTVISNTTGSGGVGEIVDGLSGDGGGICASGAVRALNSIVIGNSVAIGGYGLDLRGHPASDSHLSHSCVGNTHDVSGTTTGMITSTVSGLGFVDSANGDCRLLESSICIDAGLNTNLTEVVSVIDDAKDLADNPRVAFGSVDIGAYEFVGWQIEATAGAQGSIDPHGTVCVWPGTDQHFIITPFSYTHVLTITTNGVVAGTNSVFNWASVSGDGSLHVDFVSEMTTNGVPKWWLEDYGMTNDSFSVEELTDHDGDGVPSWMEYVAGTDPRSATSVFALTSVSVESNLLEQVVSWDSVPGRLYSIYTHTNLLTSWPSSAVYQVQGDGTEKTFTNVALDDQVFIRLKVQLTP